jgi:hypothetical protein
MRRTRYFLRSFSYGENKVLFEVYLKLLKKYLVLLIAKTPQKVPCSPHS